MVEEKHLLLEVSISNYLQKLSEIWESHVCEPKMELENMVHGKGLAFHICEVLVLQKAIVWMIQIRSETCQTSIPKSFLFGVLKLYSDEHHSMRDKRNYCTFLVYLQGYMQPSC